jgi:ERF superfamily
MMTTHPKEIRALTPEKIDAPEQLAQEANKENLLNNEILTAESSPVVLQPSATPADLLRMAVQGNADIDKLQQLVALQERWEAGQAVRAFAAAFAAFKSEAVTILKNKSITSGPLKGGRHADLAEVVRATTPALSKHGLAINWKLSKDEKDWMEVTCTLRHSAGHSETVSMGAAPDTGPGRNAIQARGSSKTYLERYTATAILGLAASEADDDGAGGGADMNEAERDLYQILLESAKLGTAALRRSQLASAPAEWFWTKHSKALKDVALAVDEIKVPA